MTWLVRLLAILTIAGFWGGAGLAQGEQAPKEEREGGILGTGILGTITSLGSINVNGQRIVFEGNMMSDGPLGVRAASELRPDMVVAAEVVAEGADWRARRLQAYVPLLGPAVLAPDGRTTVLGAGVALPQGASLVPGRWYALSGLWRGRVLVASRVDEIPAQETGFVQGSYLAGHVGGVALTLEEGVPEGQAVQARVAVDAQTGKATTVLAYRSGLFSRPVARVIAQGYLSAPTEAGHYTILGSGLVAQTDQPSMIDPQSLGVFCATPGVAGGKAVIGALTAGSCP